LPDALVSAFRRSLLSTESGLRSEGYIAWVQPKGVPVGEIHVNDKEEASLTATTPAKSFDVVDRRGRA
jgi:hypothetical protein